MFTLNKLNLLNPCLQRNSTPLWLLCNLLFHFFSYECIFQYISISTLMLTLSRISCMIIPSSIFYLILHSLFFYLFTSIIFNFDSSIITNETIELSTKYLSKVEVERIGKSCPYKGVIGKSIEMKSYNIDMR